MNQNITRIITKKQIIAKEKGAGKTITENAAKKLLKIETIENAAFEVAIPFAAVKLWCVVSDPSPEKAPSRKECANGAESVSARPLNTETRGEPGADASGCCLRPFTFFASSIIRSHVFLSFHFRPVALLRCFFGQAGRIFDAARNGPDAGVYAGRHPRHG